MKKFVATLIMIVLLMALVGMTGAAAQDTCPPGMVCFPGSQSGGLGGGGYGGNSGGCPSGMICYSSGYSTTFFGTGKFFAE